MLPDQRQTWGTYEAHDVGAASPIQPAMSATTSGSTCCTASYSAGVEGPLPEKEYVVVRSVNMDRHRWAVSESGLP